MHIIDTREFTPEWIDHIHNRALELEPIVHAQPGDPERAALAETLRGAEMADFFREDSTRTNGSFQAAWGRLGGYAVSFDPRTMSLNKGESMEDTIVTIAAHADILVYRDSDDYASQKAAEYVDKEVNRGNISPCQVINAGSGSHEHPTQAILDGLTIRQHYGRMDGHTIMVGNDLRFGRAVRSHLRLMSMWDNQFILASSPDMQAPKAVVQELKDRGREVIITDDPIAFAPLTNIFYWARAQRERFDDETAKNLQQLVLGRMVLEHAQEDAIALHPQPMRDEIEDELRNDPRAKWTKQANYGLSTRTAEMEYLAFHGLSAGYDVRKLGGLKEVAAA